MANGENHGGEDHEQQEEGADLTRRLVAKVAALVGITALVNQISGGSVSKLAMGVLAGKEGKEGDDEGLKEAHALHEKLDEVAEEIAHKIESEHGELSDREKAMKTVDLVGTALFAWGIRDLLPGGHGHIHQYHYGALLALTKIKYDLSDEAGRHHLVEETKSNAKAFGVISGTIAVAEGLNMDVESAYEELRGSSPSTRDRIAIMSMLASALSPAATTVGSASIIRKMSNDLCDGDKDTMAICESHISNLSGYLLVGDPPFIAMNDKYGAAEAMKWQLENMFALAVYSMFRCMYQLNLLVAKKEGLSGAAAKAKARKDTLIGFRDNIPVLGRMLYRTLGNVLKYQSGADLLVGQKKGGLEVSIGEVIMDKLKNLAKLPFSDEFDASTHQEHEGMVRGDTPKVQAVNEVMDKIVERMAPQQDGLDEKRRAFMEAIEDRDYDTMRTLGTEMGVANIEVYVEILMDFHDNEHVDDSVTADPKSALSRLNPLAIYERATSMKRIKNAAGHNLGDVIDVFPFQAGCVPFLTPVFLDVMNQVEKLGDLPKDLIGFLLIMGFSMIADNYVACKIGLEIFPNKPQIPLIAAIQGGSMSAIGNMANIAQFTLDDFPLMDSLKRIGMHVEPAVVGLAWAKVLEVFHGMGIGTVPKVLKGVGAETAQEHASSSDNTPSGQVEMTRRDLFSMFRGNKAA